jgi:hypothetical protein
MERAATFVLADIEPGRRCVATSYDPDLGEAVVAGSLIGREVRIAGRRIEGL